MKELRDIKLDLLMGKENPIVNLFNKITKDIKIINCEVYHKEGIEFIYYKDDQWIFYQDCNNEEFWCNYDIYWSLFESNFNLEYEDIQEVTKYLVEQNLKRKLDTTFWIGSPTIDSIIDSVGQALKRELGTPVDYYTKYGDKVGEALKREVGTPEADPLAGFFHVEDALKKEIATPNKMTSMIGRFVERYIKKNKL